MFSVVTHMPFGMSRNAVEGTMRILHECAWIRILPLNIDGGFLIPLYSGPSGVTRRQYLVNILLDVMVQDTGFTVKFTKNFMNLRFVQTNLPFFSNKAFFAQKFCLLLCLTILFVAHTAKPSWIAVYVSSAANGKAREQNTGQQGAIWTGWTVFRLQKCFRLKTRLLSLHLYETCQNSG